MKNFAENIDAEDDEELISMMNKVTDSLTVIVSEETGVISIAQHGKLTRFLDIKTVEKTLLNIYFDKETSGTMKEKLSKALKGVKNAEE